MRPRRMLPTILIIALSLSSIPAGHSQAPIIITEQGFGLNRSSPLTIKIVFLGIIENDLNSTYLMSNVTLPTQVPNHSRGAIEHRRRLQLPLSGGLRGQFDGDQFRTVLALNTEE